MDKPLESLPESPLKDFVKTIRLLVNGTITLEIRRSNLLQDALKAARKSNFNQLS
jgi:hypothetical protein